MTADGAGAIRGAGLRVTGSRVAVLEALRALPHASADDVHRAVVARTPQASRQSVYNALGDFVDAGLVRRIEPAGSPMLFEIRVDDNHHHLVCRLCGAVADVDCLTGDAPCLAPADAHGFVVDTAEIVFWGLCPDCAASSTEERTS
ncbi:Fur family transcriptional regulator [Pseudolysinimonas sp.]|uniref:Fur family transcriptional regulator n=1 Tax=Pseudolysinimonas sp. TaxID=2680009 RepID=UPI003F81C212